MEEPKLLCLPNPCTSCPYRRDTPPGIWSREEYDKLPAWDNERAMAGIFLCHQSNMKAICRGWLEVHWDNWNVRFAMMTKIDMTDYKPTDVPLYSSGKEARAAGIRGIKTPSRNARAMVAKLMKLKHTKI